MQLYQYFADADPMKLIRTKTRGVGTETYRAPEVNSGLGYDPAAADVWSLGVTLFFFVRWIIYYFILCIYIYIYIYICI